MLEDNMKCERNCSSCGSICNISCPVCGKIGQLVKKETVDSLIKDSFVFFKNEPIYLCTSRMCCVVYYQESNPKYYTKQDLLVPIWYKEKYNQYMVCYCRKIYLNDIVELVKNIDKDNLTKADIIKILKKDTIHSDCLHSNPTGRSCDILFENAIKYAYKQKRGD